MISEMTEAEKYIRGQLDLNMMTGRYSSGLVTELLCLEYGSAHIFAILQEIGALEGAPFSRPTRAKPEAPLRPPLSGLLHKHYLQPRSKRSIATNVRNYWGRGLSGFFDPAKAIMQDQTVPYEKKAEALSRAVVDGYRKRSKSQKLTGEWIVYARHQEANYYLTLGTHGEDEAIRNRVLACCREFPHLEICR